LLAEKAYVNFNMKAFCLENVMHYYYEIYLNCPPLKVIIYHSGFER